MKLALTLEALGFVAVVAGVALWSVAAALVVAGLALILAAQGLTRRQEGEQ